MIDSTHAALLLGISKNLKNTTAIKVYADYLQEQGNPGWMIVANYPITDWPVWANDTPRLRTYYHIRNMLVLEHWRLPWLEGSIIYKRRIEQSRSRIKQMLVSYAKNTDMFDTKMVDGLSPAVVQKK